MWKKISDEMPPIGAPVLLCAKVDTQWRFMAVPEWTDQNRAMNKKKTGIFWQLIQKPDEEKLEEGEK